MLLLRPYDEDIVKLDTVEDETALRELVVEVVWLCTRKTRTTSISSDPWSDVE